MNSLDIALIVVVALYALAGYYQGFLVNVVSTIGLVLGGLIAVALVPRIITQDPPTMASASLILVVVVGSAILGHGVGSVVGAGLRQGLRAKPLRWLDAITGAALSIVVALAGAWALGYAVSGTQVPYFASASRHSSILRQINAVMPDKAGNALDSLNKALDSSMFPRYLEPFQDEPIVDVKPPNPKVLGEDGVRKAARSVVKVQGRSRCDKGIEGSGFVYGPDRVMTNAHVVAGVDRPTVEIGGRSMNASVVLFNPELDIAVLAVDNLHVVPLALDETGEAGDEAAILGYPQSGPFDARAARIRTVRVMDSPDIYDRGRVSRQTFSVRGLVRPGNSGGPLISKRGTVLGMIFAASVSDRKTGYALTAQQVIANARAGLSATIGISTGACV